MKNIPLIHVEIDGITIVSRDFRAWNKQRHAKNMKAAATKFFSFFSGKGRSVIAVIGLSIAPGFYA